MPRTICAAQKSYKKNKLKDVHDFNLPILRENRDAWNCPNCPN